MQAIQKSFTTNLRLHTVPICSAETHDLLPSHVTTPTGYISCEHYDVIVESPHLLCRTTLDLQGKAFITVYHITQSTWTHVHYGATSTQQLIVLCRYTIAFKESQKASQTSENCFFFRELRLRFSMLSCTIGRGGSRV